MSDAYGNELRILRLQLAESQEALKTSNGQLHCLMNLLKSACNGDKTAVDELSKIVGGDNTSLQEFTVKNGVVKNGTISTTSILHSECDGQSKAQNLEGLNQLMYRINYLNNLKIHQDKQTSQITHKKKRLGTPSKPATEYKSCNQYDALKATEQVGKVVEDTDSMGIKQGYEQPGLFDSSPFVHRIRPVSAKLLQDGDNRRARPKSGVVSERPLKYETTRPISSKTPQSDAKRPLSSTNQKTVKQKAPLQAEVADVSPTNQEFEKTNNESPKANDPVHKFSNDLKKMKEMESLFKMTTLDIQKKIGIRPEGIIQ